MAMARVVSVMTWILYSDGAEHTYRRIYLALFSS